MGQAHGGLDGEGEGLSNGIMSNGLQSGFFERGEVCIGMSVPDFGWWTYRKNEEPVHFGSVGIHFENAGGESLCGRKSIFGGSSVFCWCGNARLPGSRATFPATLFMSMN